MGTINKDSSRWALNMVKKRTIDFDKKIQRRSQREHHWKGKILKGRKLLEKVFKEGVLTTDAHRQKGAPIDSGNCQVVWCGWRGEVEMHFLELAQLRTGS